MALGEFTVTAGLLIHSKKMEMPFLVSELLHSSAACSRLGIADFLHNCGLRCRLAHTFPLCSLSIPLLQVPENEVSRWARSMLRAHPGSSSTSEREEELELLRNRFCSSSAFPRASAQDSLSAWIQSRCGCPAVSEEDPFS